MDRISRSLLLVPVFIYVGVNIIGCEKVVPGGYKGAITNNQPPIVEFANVPQNNDTFSYAPVIHWKGRDPDGFVEYYEYADIIDPAAVENPEEFIPYIPREAWVRTESTSDTIYLITSPGVITPHIFYVRCTDDRGAKSEVKFRSFYRSNNPPNVPLIKWFTASDNQFTTDLVLTDTLYCLDNTTSIWPGLGFNWKADDPDDRDLYKIPLRFKYYLERVPHDTIWRWVAREWTQRQDLTITGLPTGTYRLTVWSQDDGYELCRRPASVIFNVIKPSFENSILLFNTTYEDPAGREGRGNVIPGTQVGDLYRSLVESYAPPLDYFYLPYPNPENIAPNKALLSRYKLVIWFSESLSGVAAPFEQTFREYVRAGGKLWVVGSFLRKNVITNTTLSLANNSLFAGPLQGVNVPTNEAEFQKAVPGVRTLPYITIDTSKSGSVFRNFWGRYRTYPLLPGVDIMSAGQDVETVYNFYSYTDTLSGEVNNEPAEIKAVIDTIYYPPTPTDCLVKLQKRRVLEVRRVENVTRGVRGEIVSVTNNVGRDRVTVVKVSYPYGEPWALTDSVYVDYRYQPYSDFHLKPIGIRYEKIERDREGAVIVLYRVAVFTFPLYFMDNSGGEVNRMFREMISWFLNPFAH